MKIPAYVDRFIFRKCNAKTKAIILYYITYKIITSSPSAPMRSPRASLTENTTHHLVIYSKQRCGGLDILCSVRDEVSCFTNCFYFSLLQVWCVRGLSKLVLSFLNVVYSFQLDFFFKF